MEEMMNQNLILHIKVVVRVLEETKSPFPEFESDSSENLCGYATEVFR